VEGAKAREPTWLDVGGVTGVVVVLFTSISWCDDREVASWCGERGGCKADSYWDGEHDLPSFRSRNGDEILHATINHYMGNKCAITMMRSVLS
jgi:hypothetical protein